MIQPAALEELLVMAEAAQISRLGQDEQSQDRTNAGNRLQSLEASVIGQANYNLFLQLPAQPAQMQVFIENDPEHAGRLRILWDGQPDAVPCRRVEISQLTGLVDLLSGQQARRLQEYLKGNISTPPLGRARATGVARHGLTI